uniref:Uncharacterized protein n=1 Tax=Rhodosorus marinus TaxID=101924 RepID=A0A7S3E9U4_9RHOD|mmetsp:Transcript_19344/g.77337  ORF Transcript_19344/g.77337 Transcript_19344/m.77337 type:complete len:148 (+) Transcript_19344:806-1249(+)
MVTGEKGAGSAENEDIRNGTVPMSHSPQAPVGQRGANPMVEDGSVRVLEAEAAPQQAIATTKTGASLGETTGMTARTIDARTMTKTLSALRLAASTMMRKKVNVTGMNALRTTGRTATKEATRTSRRTIMIPVMMTTAIEMGTKTES